MKRRTKSQRRGEDKSGYRPQPGNASNPFVLWKRRPCNTTPGILQYIVTGAECPYLKENPTDEPSDCPLYDSRYCPPSDDIDNE